MLSLAVVAAVAVAVALAAADVAGCCCQSGAKSEIRVSGILVPCVNRRMCTQYVRRLRRRLAGRLLMLLLRFVLYMSRCNLHQSCRHTLTDDICQCRPCLEFNFPDMARRKPANERTERSAAQRSDGDYVIPT